jgi:hypothetical protein
MRGEIMTTTTKLTVSWGISRGRETAGWNISRLRDDSTGKRYRCMGGGYDMQGTTFGEWLQDTYQTRLQGIAYRAHMRWTRTDNDGPWDMVKNDDGLYGMSFYTHDGRVVLDGGCGFRSMERIAEAIGLTVRTTVNRKGHATGYIVTDNGEE